MDHKKSLDNPSTDNISLVVYHTYDFDGSLSCVAILLQYEDQVVLRYLHTRDMNFGLDAM